jgi:hypothetical protein
MKLIALPDLHGYTSHLPRIQTELAAADWILLPGDLTNGSPRELAAVLDMIRGYNQHILAVPGNMDNQTIHADMIAQGIDLHASHRVIDGIAFLGVGGALPFFGRFVFEEPQLAAICQATLQDLPPNLPTLLICHQPPRDTLNDRLINGQHVGSQAVREFIENHPPLICFTGHIHEAVGIDRIGATHIINPGRAGYAYAEILDGAVKALECRKI